MKKRNKQLIVIGSGIVCLFIALLAVKLLADRSYRMQIPALPDFANVSRSLQEQITAANQRAIHRPNGDNLGMLGMVYNSGGNYEKAVQCYRLAAKKEPKNWIWDYYSGCIKMEMGEPRKAISCFNNVLKVNPKAFMAIYYSGVAYQSVSSTDTAEIYLSKIGNMDEKDFYLRKSSRTSYFPIPTYAKFQLARIYMITHRSELAEKQLKEILRSQIAFGPAYRQLSSLYATKGDSISSRYYSSRASDLIPYLPPPDTLIDKFALMSRSDEFLMKQIDLAIKSANSGWADELLIVGLKYFSDNQFFISKAIKQFLSTGMYEMAIPLLDRHLRYCKNIYSELVSVGIQLADAGFKIQAKKYFVQAESLTKEEPEVRSSLALLMFEKVGLQENARSLMSEIIEKNPDDVKVIIHGVFLYLQIDEKEKALQLLGRLKRLSPSNSKVVSLDGVVAEQEGKLGQAIALYEKAFKMDTKDRYIIDHLGAIYLREKMWAKAIDFFRKALRSYPNYSSVQVNLGGLLVACPDESLRNIQEGIEYSERAFINYDYTIPIHISAGRNLAIAYDRLGDRNKANYYIKSTIEFARKAHVSKDYLKNLEDLSYEFSSLK